MAFRVSFRRIEIFAKSRELAIRMAQKEIKVKTNIIKINLIDEGPVKFKMKNIMPWITKEEICKALFPFGEAIEESIFYEFLDSEKEEIMTGTISLLMVKKSNTLIPKDITVVIGPDQHRWYVAPADVLCYNCGGRGHFMKYCEIDYNKEDIDRRYAEERERRNRSVNHGDEVVVLVDQPENHKSINIEIEKSVSLGNKLAIPIVGSERQDEFDGIVEDNVQTAIKDGYNEAHHTGDENATHHLDTDEQNVDSDLVAGHILTDEEIDPIKLGSSETMPKSAEVRMNTEVNNAQSMEGVQTSKSRKRKNFAYDSTEEILKDVIYEVVGPGGKAECIIGIDENVQDLYSFSYNSPSRVGGEDDGKCTKRCIIESEKNIVFHEVSSGGLSQLIRETAGNCGGNDDEEEPTNGHDSVDKISELKNSGEPNAVNVVLMELLEPRQFKTNSELQDNTISLSTTQLELMNKMENQLKRDRERETNENSQRDFLVHPKVDEKIPSVLFEEQCDNIVGEDVSQSSSQEGGSPLEEKEESACALVNLESVINRIEKDNDRYKDEQSEARFDMTLNRRIIRVLQNVNKNKIRKKKLYDEDTLAVYGKVMSKEFLEKNTPFFQDCNMIDDLDLLIIAIWKYETLGFTPSFKLFYERLMKVPIRKNEGLKIKLDDNGKRIIPVCSSEMYQLLKTTDQAVARKGDGKKFMLEFFEYFDLNKTKEMLENQDNLDFLKLNRRLKEVYSFWIQAAESLGYETCDEEMHLRIVDTLRG